LCYFLNKEKRARAEVGKNLFTSELLHFNRIDPAQLLAEPIPKDEKENHYFASL
jgi:hypothetical protein